MIRHSVDSASFIRKLQQHERDITQRSARVLELSAREAVNFATSNTSATVPGINPGDGPRNTHPGGWADRTSNLVNSIQVGKVKITRGAISVDFGVGAEKQTQDVSAAMEYASILDDKDGYSVLGGADRVARQALNRNAKRILQ